MLDTMCPYRIIRDFQPRGEEKSLDGSVRKVSHPRIFDFSTGRLNSKETLYVRGRKPVSLTSSLRLYHPHELVRLLEQTGFRVLHFFGDLRGGDLTLESGRLVILSERK